MKICFLGTSSGVPTRDRNVSAVAIIESQGSDWYLIDCGEGTQHQLLRTSLSVNSLKAIFITHIHGDHCYGLPGLLASAGMNGRTAPLTIVAPRGIREWLEATQRHTELFFPYEIKFEQVEDFTPKLIGKTQIDVAQLSHRVPSFAYSFTETENTKRLDGAKLSALGVPKGPLWGQLQAGNDIEFQGNTIKSCDYLIADNAPRKVVVCGDNDNPELLQELCKSSQVLVHESTYTQEMAAKAGDVGHSYARQVAEFAESANIDNLVLTHFSARYQQDLTKSPNISDIENEAKSAYSRSLFLAQDFQVLTLDKRGVLHLEQD